MAPTITAPTVGEIARRLGQAVHRVEYVIRSRSIQPAGRAGHIRIFSEADVARIAYELHAIEARQSGEDDQA